MALIKLRELFLTSELVKKLTAGPVRVYGQLCAELDPYISKAAESALVQFIARHMGRLSLCLYMVWLAGCGYWIYELIMLDVQLGAGWDLGISDSRDALVYLFFGLLGSIFVLFFVLFTAKLLYNLFQDGVESIFPDQWQSVARSTVYLAILMFAFSHTASIKAAGLSAFYQMSEIVDTSKNRSVIINKKVSVDDLEKKLNALMEMMEEKRKGR